MKVIITATAMAIALTVVLAGCMLFGNNGTPRSNQPAAAKNERLSRTDTFVLKGTVVEKDLEGGFFAIVGDDGKTYEPLNLPEAFKNNGMRIKATVRARDDVGSIHMVGDIVEIVDIAAQ